MEVAVIDWKNLDSKCVKDELYEHINAPKWVDLSAPDDPVDDEAWFCRPGCDHPKRFEDFFNEKERSSNSKLNKLACVSNVPPLGDKNKSCRDATLKKRGINKPFALTSKDTAYVEDSENQDPNFSTPLNHKVKAAKETIKSSTEKKQISDTIEYTPKLRSTLSARNLFSGGDLLNKVAEFCSDLKRLATRGRDKENAEDNVVGKDAEKGEAGDRTIGCSDILKDKEKERKPLLAVGAARSEVMETSSSKGQQRRKKRNTDDAENTPISIDVKSSKNLSQIRTCPPTPQCFSADRSGTSKTTKTKPFRPRPLNPEGSILQERKQINREEFKKVEREDKMKDDENEAKPLDVFWFLKPCTLSS